MKTILIIFLLWSFPLHSFAGIFIVSLLPNPVWDDTLGEYIEIRNTGCEEKSLSWYTLSDLGGKVFIFSSGTILATKSSEKYYYSQTKIVLGNSWNESVFFKDQSGVLIDSFSYSWTQKDDIILSIAPVDETCDTISHTGEVLDLWEDETSESGSLDIPLLTDSWSVSFSGVESSGGVIPQNTWAISTGSLFPWENSLSWWTNTGELLTETGVSNTNNSSTFSGVIHSGSTFSWNISFPPIIPSLQSPTNALFSSGVFICHVIDCRINLTLEPVFSTWFLMKDFSCFFGTWEILALDADCNPNTYYFPSSWNIWVEFVSKANTSEKISHIFPVIFEITNDQTPNISVIWNSQIEDHNPPVIILERDGKWKSYYEEIGEYELNCYSLTCAINLTAERSYDPEWSPLRFLWMYDFAHPSESKDPWERKFSLGDHDIWLRVMDASDNMSEIHYTLHVLWEKEKVETIIKARESQTKKEKIEKTPKKEKKKKVSKSMTFFNPPELILQNSDSQNKRYDGLTCITTETTCVFNFTLSNTIKKMIYTWQYDNEKPIISNNPRSLSLSPWIHTLHLSASYEWEGEPIWHETYAIKVISEKKAKIKKPKKAKAPKAKAPKTPKTSSEVDEGKSQTNDLVIPDPKFPFEILYFFIPWWGYLLLRKKFFSQTEQISLSEIENDEKE